MEPSTGFQRFYSPRTSTLFCISLCLTKRYIIKELTLEEKKMDTLHPLPITMMWTSLNIIILLISLFTVPTTEAANKNDNWQCSNYGRSYFSYGEKSAKIDSSCCFQTHKIVMESDYANVWNNCPCPVNDNDDDEDCSIKCNSDYTSCTRHWDDLYCTHIANQKCTNHGGKVIQFDTEIICPLASYHDLNSFFCVAPNCSNQDVLKIIHVLSENRVTDDCDMDIRNAVLY